MGFGRTTFLVLAMARVLYTLRVAAPCSHFVHRVRRPSCFISDTLSSGSISVRLSSAGNEHAEPSKENDRQDETGMFSAAKSMFKSIRSRNKELAGRLKRYGLSGVLSYGLLNTVYYLGTFLFVWFYVSPSPGQLGYAAAAQRFFKLLAMVWAGSQVTKLLRAAVALALAPLVDQALTSFTHKFQFQSREKAFAFLVGSCFTMALLIFAAVTTLWA